MMGAPFVSVLPNQFMYLRRAAYFFGQNAHSVGWNGYDMLWCRKWSKAEDVCVVVDVATRWALAEVSKSADAKMSINTVSFWLLTFGCLPQNLISGNGREFSNGIFCEWLEAQGCTKLWTLA